MMPPRQMVLSFFRCFIGVWSDEMREIPLFPETRFIYENDMDNITLFESFSNLFQYF